MGPWFATVDMCFLVAVAMYGEGLLGLRRMIGPFFATADVGFLVAAALYDKVLVGLRMMFGPWFSTTDVGFLVSVVMYDEGLIEPRRTIGPLWFANAEVVSCVTKSLQICTGHMVKNMPLLVMMGMVTYKR